MPRLTPEFVRKAHWEQNAQLYTKIPDFGSGGLAAVVRRKITLGHLPDLNTLLIPQAEQIIGCMDGGVQHRGVLGMGGSGILHLPGFIRKELRKERTIPACERALLKHLERMPFNGFTSHPDCGGGEISYREVYGLPPEAQINPATLDAYSQETAVLVARATGKPYLGGVELSRDEGFHPTNMVVYTAKPVDPERLMNGLGLEDLDQPMNVYRPGHVSPETAVRDIEVAVKAVLMGPKGHGDRFSQETPLGIILIGSEQIPLDQLKKELSSVLKGLGGKVAVDGFEFPD